MRNRVIFDIFALIRNYLIHKLFLVAIPLILLLSSFAQAQVGIGFLSDGSYSGTIGFNKGQASAYKCPDGMVLRGLYHVDKAMIDYGGTPGMTSQVGLYCASIKVDASLNVSIVNYTANGNPNPLGFAFRNPGTVRHGYCDSSSIVARLGGYDRGHPWASSLFMHCRRAQTGTGDWIEISSTNSSSVLVGVNETDYAPHTLRGPFCDSTSSTSKYNAVSGIYRQTGGEGYDGINVYCTTISQARLSAFISFTNYGWNKTLGGSGWAVNLTRGGSLLSSSAFSGANKTPYASAAANDPNRFNTNSEIYVLPNSGYGASISQRPSGTNTNSYVVTSNTCASGIRLSERQDASCGIYITGRPDLAVDIETPENPYDGVYESQNVILRVRNVGPAEVSSTWGYGITATVPAGWEILPADLPSGCTFNTPTLSCNITSNLAAAPSSGATGGTQTFTVPFTTNPTVVAGSYPVPLSLNRTVPDASGNLVRIDYNTANDTDRDIITYEPHVNLTIVKTTIGDVGSFQFNFEGLHAPVVETITTDTIGDRTMGTSHALKDGEAVVVTEALVSGMWRMTSVECVIADNLSIDVVLTNVDYTNRTFEIPAQYIDNNNDLVCSIENVARNITTSKSSDIGAGTSVYDGDIITYTLTTVVDGAATEEDLTLTDTLSDGLEFISFGTQSPANSFTTSGSGPNLTFVLPSGAAVGTYRVSYSARVVASSATSPTVSNSVVHDAGECNNCTTQNPITSVSHAKTANPPDGESVQPGDIITYTLTSVVVGGDTPNDIVLTDTLGPGLDFTIVSSTGNFVSDSSAAPTLKFTLPAGTPAGPHSVIYQAQVNDQAAGTVGNNVTADIGNCTPSCSTEHDVVDIVISKSTNIPDGSSVGLNDIILYTLTVVVDGGSTTKPLVLTDTLGNGLSYDGVEGSAGDFNVTYDSQVPNIVTFTLPANRQAGTYAVTYRVRVNTDTVEFVSNTVISDNGNCVSCETTTDVNGYFVTKTADVADNQAVQRGDVLTYTMTIDIQGNNPSEKDIVIVDTLSAGLEYKPNSAVSDTILTTANSTQSLTFTLPEGSETGPHTVTYQAIVAMDSAITVVNNNLSPQDQSVHCTDCSVVNPVVNAATSKSSNVTAGTSVTPGDTITYGVKTVISAAATDPNIAGVTTKDIVIVDTLGPGLSYVEGSVTGDFIVDTSQPNSITFTLLAGTPVGTYDASYEAVVTNAATIDVNNSLNTNYGTCVPCEVTIPISKISTRKTSDPDGESVAAGAATIDYTVVVTVTENKTGKDVVLTDTLGEGLTYVPGSLTGSTEFTTLDDSAAPILRFILAAETPVGVYTVTYSASVDADATDEVGNNVVSSLGTCDDCETINPVSGVWIKKEATPADGTSVWVGDEITYKLTVEVEGADTSQPVTFHDTLGPGLSYVAGTATSPHPEVIINDTDPTNLEFTLQAPAIAGVDYEITYQARVEPGASGNVKNAVVIDSGGQCSDDCVVVNPLTKVSLAKSNDVASGATVMQGDVLTYTINVTVADEPTSQPFEFSDTLGPGLEFIPNSIVGPNFTWDDLAAPHLSFTLPAPAGVGVHTLTYKARVLQTAQTTVSNEVEPITNTPACDTECEVINPVSRVVTSKSAIPADQSVVNPGDIITYFLKVAVDFNSTSKPVVLTDTLGAGLTYVPGSATDTTGSSFQIIDGTAPVLTFTLPTGTAPGDHIISYQAKVNLDAVDEVANNVVADTGACDDCEVTHPISGVWVTKTASVAEGTSVWAGDEITYTVKIEVEGAATPVDVVLTDTLGTGLTYVQGSATQSHSQIIVEEIGTPTLRITLPAGAPAGVDYIVTYKATVDKDATAQVSNQVTVNSGGLCTDDCNIVNPVSEVTVEKTNDFGIGGTVMENDEITFRIQADVTGAPTSQPLVLLDTLGDGLEYVPGSGSGAGFQVDASQAPLLTITLVAPAAVGTHDFTYKARVTVDADVEVDNVIKSGSSIPVCEINCSTTNPVSSVVTSKTAIVDLDQPIWIDSIISYKLNVTVSGAETTAPVTLTDTLGSGLTFVPGSVNAGAFTPDVTAAPVLLFTLPAGTPVGSYDVTYQGQVNEDAALAGVTEVTNNVVVDLGVCAPGACSVVTPVEPPTMNIDLIKTADLRVIKRGELAPFTLVATNRESYAARDVTVVDTIPVGFRYVEGSSTIDGVAQEPIISGRDLIYSGLVIPGAGQAKIMLTLQALSTIPPGKHRNVAVVLDKNGTPISNQAIADVEILVEPVFDCGDVIGKVFDDRNRNGQQDEGELGLPGVRIATAKGWIITTDQYGRWHIPCAALPEQRVGSNFIAKIDERSLPSGYRLTTENPKVVRLTAGKMTSINFGASVSRVVRVDISDAAFEAGKTALKPEWGGKLSTLMAVLHSDVSVLRLNYISTAEQKSFAKDRLIHLRKDIAKLWQQSGAPYRLDIESNIEAAK